jgi:hypothetical protein
MIEGVRVAPGSAPRIADRDAKDDLGLGDKATAKARRDEPAPPPRGTIGVFDRSHELVIA